MNDYLSGNLQIDKLEISGSKKTIFGYFLYNWSQSFLNSSQDLKTSVLMEWTFISK
jgi:hypothetical protein